ncbi:MAG: hypothetical protein IKU10_08270 [Clostridia bacterium]|nr:hypothetical protein [Clostridia bacterium]
MATNGYTNNDLANMQREAERRVMEMRQRAKATVNATPQQPPPTTPPPPAPKRDLLSMLNLKSFLEGKDTSLVLMVLALLSAEETDPLLLLALLYVML